MTNQEAVKNILTMNSCLGAKEISARCKRILGLDISPAKVSGALRAMVARGEAASSNCGVGQTVYWLNEV